MIIEDDIRRHGPKSCLRTKRRAGRTQTWMPLEKIEGIVETALVTLGDRHSGAYRKLICDVS